MTIYNGINYDKYMAGQVLDQGLWGGKVQVAYDKFAYTANSGSGDVVKLCKLPKNARVLPISVIKTSAATTLSVGIEGATDKFVSSGSVNGITTFAKADGTQLGVEGPITVTITSTNTAPTIEVWVFYVQAG